MNLHFATSHTARAEMKEIMCVGNNIVSPQSNQPVMGIIQDALLSCRFMTKRDTFVDKTTVMNIMMKLEINDARKLPKPAILKPKPLWTGKQLFNFVLPETNKICMFLEKKNAWHDDENDNKYFSVNDTYVNIYQGELLSGTLCKKTLGMGNGGLVHTVWLEWGAEECVKLISYIQFVANEWLQEHGFSCGISDCVRTNEMSKKVKDTVKECEREVMDIIDEATISATSASKYEDKINTILNKARDHSGRAVQQSNNEYMSPNNIQSMISAGSKGSILNIAQIMACVGQQNVNGKRIEYGYVGRTLPHFQKNDYGPESKGFVKHSYFDGLTPAEQYFHAMGGREGVIDTAIKTSESGYIQRRLVKAMEDITIDIFGTVRNSIGNILQLCYGEDGFDGSRLLTSNVNSIPKEVKEKFPHIQKTGLHLPIDFDRIYRQAQEKSKEIPKDIYVYISEDFIENVMDELNKINKSCNGHSSQLFDEMIKHYFTKDKLETLSEYGLSWLQDEIVYYYRKAKVQTGEMVGVIAAQSLGQPITQMTLNTFHSCGISAKNVTLGVPRLKELINLAKNIKSPSMDIHMKEEFKEHPEYYLTCLKLKDIIESHEIHYHNDNYQWKDYEKEYLEIMDNESLKDSINLCKWVIYLKINTQTCAEHGISFSDITFVMNRECDLIWTVSNTKDREIVIHFFTDTVDETKIKTFYNKISHDLIIKGFTQIEDCFENPEIPNLVETKGSYLEKILSCPYINPYKTITNNVIEVLNCLGIEAARNVLLKEIKNVIEFDGSYVNHRHLSILIDIMTYKGSLMAITRHGMNRTEVGVLMRCSFEETVKIITDAAMHAEKDTLRGVTENIMLGKSANIGTGTIDIVLDTEKIEKHFDKQANENEYTNKEEENMMLFYRPSSPTPNSPIMSFENSWYPE
jgi:DNA-directed RNA polymerase II subunit RPB1